MTARAASLKQSDLTRYAKALRAAGVEEWRVVVHRNGTHEIVAGSASSSGGMNGPDPDELLK